jgi:hypothetical protein
MSYHVEQRAFTQLREDGARKISPHAPIKNATILIAAGTSPLDDSKYIFIPFRAWEETTIHSGIGLFSVLFRLSCSVA